MELLTKASFAAKPNEREKLNFRTAYKAACESIVLLENDGTLPISVGKVALYGSGAKRTIKGGTGSGEVNERHSVSIYEGLKKAGFTITTEEWLKEFDVSYRKAKKEFLDQKLKNLVKNPKDAMKVLEDFGGIDGRYINDRDVLKSETDVCIYVLSRQAGEGVDRRAKKGDMFVTDAEEENIRFCAENYEKFVLIINAGAQLDVSFLDEIEGINAVLFICQLGTAGGKAVANVLSGKVSPSGKLASTWAMKYADIPYAEEFSYLNGNLENEYYKEGIYVGYRYFDTFDVTPRYPFGYGKTYSKFRFDNIQTVLEGSRVSVSVEVTNIGAQYSGKEVVQVYVSAPMGKMDKEYQSLAGFAKTKKLAPNQTQRLTITFDMTALASYFEEDAAYLLESGEYVVRVGNSSRDTIPCAVLCLKEEVIISKHTNICKRQNSFMELKSEGKTEIISEEVLRLEVSKDAFETVEYSYETPKLCTDERVRAFVDTLSLEEMAEIVVGNGMFGGETKFTMPGAVGNTTSKFWDRGLVNVTMCDGPAGIRIQKRSALIAGKKVKMIDPPFSFFEMLPKALKKQLLADPKTSVILYQYTTAFPVSAALAQTWNTELLYQVGVAVHEEMKEYGCTFWLAPALNIHRNPLCGRNFEYYSEDPFLTGSMAAAITRGVQCEDGYYVTIKHFACNNQEDNRKGVSANVSERALREIYLRGFEKAVKEAGAKGVMTSYNKVNQVYTPNSYDLCTKVLRNEWSFDGVVMTDWFSTSKGCAGADLAMAAGNDLIMPGGKNDKKAIVIGVKRGTIKSEDVKRCCVNVVKSIFDSALQKEYIN